MRKRKQLLYAHCNNLISDEEFLLLYDLNTSKTLDLEYWLYPKLGLEAVSNDVINKFRFQKCDIYWLQNALSFPDEIRCHCYNDLNSQQNRDCILQHWQILLLVELLYCWLLQSQFSSYYETIKQGKNFNCFLTLFL